MSGIYGENLEHLQKLTDDIVKRIGDLRTDLRTKNGNDPVEHCLARIKDEESMREKCRRKGLPEDETSALEKIRDAIGIRVVCPFISDVYDIRDFLTGLPGCELVEEKDYIRHAKPNGYRSLHLILYIKTTDAPREGYYVEVQLRTISMDTWAALEHQLKYKKDIGSNTELIVSELKRCADELASTDLSMQTIRDMINGQEIR